MGNGVLAIGPKLPRPSSTLPQLTTCAGARIWRLSRGQLKLRDRSVNRLSAAAFDPEQTVTRKLAVLVEQRSRLLRGLLLEAVPQRSDAGFLAERFADVPSVSSACVAQSRPHNI
jgi:hypothetical protein